MTCSQRSHLELLGVLIFCCAACTSNTIKQNAQPKQPRVSHNTPQFKTSKVEVPKRIILMIGDGMGTAAISAATWHKGTPLEMLHMPHQTLMRTHEYEYVTTDSAASATALSTGYKTHYEGVSVTPGTTKVNELDPSRHLHTLVELAKKAGLKTGLVATSRIVHATPAAFASHRFYRSDYEDIALDMSKAKVDVLLGAGSKYFTVRKDGQDLLALMATQGYSIAKTAAEVTLAQKSAVKLVGLMHEKDMPSILKGGRAMSLSHMIESAIEVLDRDNDTGFFLMVEGSQIDWEEHDMNGSGTVLETLDFDDAVGVARRYASKRKDTLVVVTADHETGGLAVFDPADLSMLSQALGGRKAIDASVQSKKEGVSYPRVMDDLSLGQGAQATTLTWSKALTTVFGFLSVASRANWLGDQKFLATHTATMVPLFAQGVASKLIAQVHDNADLGRKLHELIQARVDQRKSPKPTVLNESLVFSNTTPRNVVLMIASGAGAASLTATYYGRGRLAMLDAPVTGFVSTAGYDYLVADEASAATALATGKRTMRGALGVVPNAQGNLAPTLTLLEAAVAQGKRTGLISTSSFDDPTLAAFYAHGKWSKDSDAQVKSLLNFGKSPSGHGVDLLFAGGGRRLGKLQREALYKQGVTIQDAWSNAPIDVLPHWRLHPDDALLPASERLSTSNGVALSKMTTAALKTLSGNPQGFFLVIEGGQIDRRIQQHDTSDALIEEIHDFDRAVAEAFEFARQHGDTLVVVTSDRDHSLSLLDTHYGFVKSQCGIAKRCQGTHTFKDLPIAVDRIRHNEGLMRADLQGVFAPPAMLLQYAWLPEAARTKLKGTFKSPATAHLVPIFALGPGADRFSGFFAQERIGRMLMKVLTAPLGSHPSIP